MIDFPRNPPTDLATQPILRSEPARIMRGPSDGKTIGNCQKSQPPTSLTMSLLPDELLLEVFSFACCQPINVGRLREPIWDLQQVCVGWQRLVKSTPTLWCAFEVTTGDVPIQSIILRIQSCLKLSQKEPLSIYIFPPYSCAGRYPSMAKLYTDLPYHADRWKSLTIDGELLTILALQMPSMWRTLTVKQHDFPLLRTLTILHSKSLPFYVFSRATVIKEFTLISPKLIPGVNYPFPWKNIKTLTFENCNTIQAEQSLINAFTSMADSLEVLIWKENKKVLQSVPGTVITLSALHTLIIKDAEDKDGHPTLPIWDMFYMPSLTSVQFIGDVAASSESLLRMIQLSGSVVKKVQFKECQAGIVLLAADTLFDVEEVSLESLCEPKEFLAMLVWNTTDSNAYTDVINVLPSLRKLEFRDRGSHGAASGNILMDIMLSRSTAAAESAAGVFSPMQFFKWMFSSSVVDPDAAAQVKNLGDVLGIKVEVGLHWIP